MSDAHQPEPIRCGIVMPISDIDGYPTGHWEEVKEIIVAAVNSIDIVQFEIDLVSQSDIVGVIQKRIVQRLYSDAIVVCDVSAKNPNVMFELGMRLAFDKPTVLIKDDATPYIFDTGPLEHLEYPASLRHSQIQQFSKALAEKIKATYEQAQQDEDSTSYLKSFGTFEVAKIATEYVEGQDLMIRAIEGMQGEIAGLHRMLAETNAAVLRALPPPPTPPSSVAAIAATSGLGGLLNALPEYSQSGGPSGGSTLTPRKRVLVRRKPGG